MVDVGAPRPVDRGVRVDLGTDLAPMAEVKQGGAGARVPARRPPDGLAVAPAARRGVAGGLAPGRGAGPGPARPGGQPRARRAAEVAAAAHGPRRAASARGRRARVARRRSRPTTRGSRGWSTQGLADLSGLLLDPTTATGSSPRAARGSSPSSAATRCGPRGCCVPLDPELALSTLRALARPPGHARRPARPRSSPARSCTRCAAPTLDRRARCCRRSTTAPSTPPRCSSARSPTPSLGRRPAPRCGRCCRPPGAAWSGCWARRRRRRLARLRRHTPVQGLANQGWKDSHDSVQFADGRLAERADRAVRGAGLRLRGRGARARRCSPRYGGRAGAGPRRRGPADLRDPLPRGRSGSTPRTVVTSRRAGPRTARRSTR